MALNRSAGVFEDEFFDFLTARIEADSRDRCEQSAAASAGAVINVCRAVPLCAGS